jgi:hypothetical protein
MKRERIGIIPLYAKMGSFTKCSDTEEAPFRSLIAMEPLYVVENPDINKYPRMTLKSTFSIHTFLLSLWEGFALSLLFSWVFDNDCDKLISKRGWEVLGDEELLKKVLQENHGKNEK